MSRIFAFLFGNVENFFILGYRKRRSPPEEQAINRMKINLEITIILLIFAVRKREKI